MAIGCVLIVAAWLVRLPQLQLVPRFQDEGLEAMWALDVATGRHLPLTGADPYYGPLFSYVVALGYWVMGPALAWPRQLAAAAGALTVGATWWLGRLTVGRTAALGGALLTLSSRSLVTISSHYGWSNSLSPLCAVAALAAAVTGVSRGRLAWLVAAGVLAGLAAHTHPLTATAGLGLVVWLGWSPSVEERRPMGDVAALAGAAVAAYAPMLWTFAVSPVSVAEVGATRAYAFAPVSSAVEYGSRVASFAGALWSAAALGWLPLAGLSDATPGAWALACGAALVIWAAQLVRSGAAPRRLIAMIVMVSALTFPMVLQTFLTRYVSFLLPLVYLLLSDGVCRIATAAAAAVGVATTRRQALFATALAASLAVLPLATQPAYYEALTAATGSNQPFYDLRDRLRQDGGCAGPVVIEDVGPDLAGRDRNIAYYNRETLFYVLRFAGCAVEARTGPWLERRVAAAGPAWLVVTARTAQRLAAQPALTRLVEMPAGANTAPGIRLSLYRLDVAPR